MKAHSRWSIVAHEYPQSFTIMRTVGNGTSNVGCRGPDNLHNNYMQPSTYTYMVHFTSYLGVMTTVFAWVTTGVSKNFLFFPPPVIDKIRIVGKFSSSVWYDVFTDWREIRSCCFVSLSFVAMISFALFNMFLCDVCKHLAPLLWVCVRVVCVCVCVWVCVCVCVCRRELCVCVYWLTSLIILAAQGYTSLRYSLWI